MEMIMKHEGKNNFRLGHLRKDALLQIGELPTTLSCDTGVYLGALAYLARTRAPATDRREADFVTEYDVLGI